MTIDLYPFLLQPSLHTKVWGGRKLETLLGKSLPTDEPYGEAWELHDSATIANGTLAGKTLGELVPLYGEALIGAGNNPAEGFPLLAKFLDANDWLSIQVHPNDEQAKALENDPRGKTEAWLMLQAEPGATLINGVKPATTRQQMAQAIKDNTLEDLLVYTQVQAGDALFLAANTVHALGPGILLYEIQQSSDMTYRLYDFGRLGLDGKPRNLHIEKGVQVSNLETIQPILHPNGNGNPVLMVECPYFKTVRYSLQGETLAISTEGHFHALTCIEGNLAVESQGTTVQLTLGQTALIPACLPTYTLSGTGKVFCSFQP